MSSTAKTQVFTAIHTIGALLPADMLLRISEGKDVSGSSPADYQLIGARSVRDEAERHWDYLKGAWRELRTKLPYAPEAALPADPTGHAQAQWLEPLFAELGFGRLSRPAVGITSDDGGKTFPISHRWQYVPIHLTAWNTGLDKRPVPGTVPPQSLVQECLNRTEAHLWAVLSNGRQLRLLRDSTSLAGAAYVEFDLEAIFDGELFSEFVLLYRLLHVSRFEVPDGAAPSTCRLEKWRTEAIESGVRALEQLREGVQNAITTLGTGFLRHPRNAALRDTVDISAYHYALLRLVYRLLFLFVAEDRGALLHPDADENAQRRYLDYFSSARLRRHAQRRRGTAHGDLYRALRIVLDGLGSEDGRPELGLPGLGGIFDDTDADAALLGLELSNEDLLTAVRALSIVRDAGAKRNRAVDYQHLGAEELGSVYESLLELVPKHDPAERTFELVELPGNARKTTGSYYTPTSLIDCLLDSALDPVIDDAVKRGEARATTAGKLDPRNAIADELLSLTVCDPACGSGHFLVAAARRIAKRLAAVREQNPEPTVDAIRRALRDVVARCIYGVDLNPMALELAKVSLWLEALEPGRPLGFLDAHLKRGNSLLGTTPTLLAEGIPDDAFKPIEGDDKKWVAALKKRNKAERGAWENREDGIQGELFAATSLTIANASLAHTAARITAAPSNTLRDVLDQADHYRALITSPDYIRARELADAWCAAFVWPRTPEAPPAVTTNTLLDLQQSSTAVDTATLDEIVRLEEDYHFFHWHLEFPEVFTVPEDQGAPGVDERSGWVGGFSCMLGNPPWERVKLQEQEFFAARSEAIAKAPNKAVREKLIKALAASGELTDQALLDEFNAAKRVSEGMSHLLRSSGRFPLAGRGDINTYAVFSESASLAVSGHGRFGLVLPTGIATDATTAPFFSDLVRSGRLASLLDFENEAFLLSRDVHHSVRFCLLTVTGVRGHVREASFAFGTRYMEDLDARRFAMPTEEILLVNPNTGTLPVFRSRRDAEITLGIYRRVPVLIKEGDRNGNPWDVHYLEMFHSAHDSSAFQNPDSDLQKGGSLLPYYEAKQMHIFNHRWARYGANGIESVNLSDPYAFPDGRYAVSKDYVWRKLKGRWEEEWRIAWRDIARSTDERTLISAVIPEVVTSDKLPVATLGDPSMSAAFISAWSSFVVDFCVRQKIGGTSLRFHYIKQMPMLSPKSVRALRSWLGSTSTVDWLTARVLELTFTAHDMAPFAADLGDDGPPFRWDESRRELLRAELDALFFHLYGVERGDVDYIMETFPIVKRRDVASYGNYRTKELILSVYDAMAEAASSGQPYQTLLTPPPGQGPRHPANPNPTPGVFRAVTTAASNPPLLEA